MGFHRLLGSEFERFLARRMARVLVVCAVGLGLLIGVITFVVTDDQGPGRPFDTAGCVDEVMADIDRGYLDLGDPVFDDLSEREQRAVVQDWFCSQLENGDDRFHLTYLLGDATDDWSESLTPPVRLPIGDTGEREPGQGLEGILPVVGLLMAVLSGGLVGASFFGAEYRFGTIEQVLLWEPRRTRVLVAKYATVFLGSAVVAVLASLAVAFSLWPAAAFKGSTEGVDGRFWLDLVSTSGRIGIAAGLLGILAGTVAVCTRHTAGALMSLLGYQIVGGIVINLWVKWLAPWDPLFNAGAFIAQADTTKWVTVRQYGHSYDTEAYANTYLTAGLVALGFAVAAMAIGVAVFRRRDVS